jgi:hypothetical protein
VAALPLMAVLFGIKATDRVKSFQKNSGHATEIREFWEICRKNIPVSQLICKKHKKKFGWKQNMLYICNINFIKDI